VSHQIVETSFIPGSPDQDMSLVHVGGRLAIALGAREGDLLRVWTGTAERRDHSAVVIVGQVLIGESHLRLAPRL